MMVAAAHFINEVVVQTEVTQLRTQAGRLEREGRRFVRPRISPRITNSRCTGWCAPQLNRLGTSRYARSLRPSFQ